MRARTLVTLGCACDTCRSNGGGGCATYPTGKIPASTELDWQDVYLLVRAGCAEPLDEECAIAADMTEEQLKRAQYSYKRADAGIHPEDFDAYAAGEMVGYYSDGTWIPGPNATHSEGGLILDDDYE